MEDSSGVITDNNCRGSVRELRARFETSGSTKPTRLSGRGPTHGGDKPETQQRVQRLSPQDATIPFVRRNPRQSLDEGRLGATSMKPAQELPNDQDDSFANFSQTLPSKKRTKRTVERPKSYYDDGRYPQTTSVEQCQMTKAHEGDADQDTRLDPTSGDVHKSPQIHPSEIQPKMTSATRTRKMGIISRDHPQTSELGVEPHKKATQVRSLEIANSLKEDSPPMASFKIDSPTRKQDLKDILYAPRRLTPPRLSGRVVRKLGKIIYDDIDKTQEETTLLLEKKKSEKDVVSPSTDLPKTSGILTTFSENDETQGDDVKETDVTSSPVTESPGDSTFAVNAISTKTSESESLETKRSAAYVLDKEPRCETTDEVSTSEETRDVVAELKTDNKDSSADGSKLLRNGPRQRMPVPLRLNIGESDSNKPDSRRYTKKRDTAPKIQTETPRVECDNRPEFYVGSGSPVALDIEKKLDEWTSRKWNGCENWSRTEHARSPEGTTKVSNAIWDLQSQLLDLRNQDIALLRQLNQMSVIIQEMAIRSGQSRVAPDTNWSATLPSPVRGRAYSSVADLIQVAKTTSLQRSCQPVENQLHHWTNEDQLTDLPCVQETTMEMSPPPRYNRAASVPYVKVTRSLLTKRN